MELCNWMSTKFIILISLSMYDVRTCNCKYLAQCIVAWFYAVNSMIKCGCVGNNECIICDVCKLFMKTIDMLWVYPATFDFTQDDCLMLGQLHIIKSLSDWSVDTAPHPVSAIKDRLGGRGQIWLLPTLLCYDWVCVVAICPWLLP